MRKRKDLKFAAKIAQRVDESGELDCVHYAEGDMRIGEMLKMWCFKYDKKISDIAGEIGINVSTARRIEAGKQQPDFVTGMRIIMWLFSEEKHGENQGASGPKSVNSKDESGDSLETLAEGGD